MQKMSKKGLWAIGGLLLAALLAVAGHAMAAAHHNAAPCVTVNGVVLTNREVDLAYDQQKDGLTPVTRQQVIDATVRNMVVRDYGRATGIAVSQPELDELITHYRETGYYDAAVKRYGEEGLRQGLYNHELFIRTRQVILQQHITVTPVTDEDIRAFLAKNGLEGMNLTDRQRQDVTETLAETKREEAYNAFVDSLLAEATVVYP